VAATSIGGFSGKGILLDSEFFASIATLLWGTLAIARMQVWFKRPARVN
jgi:hypothetical protein